MLFIFPLDGIPAICFYFYYLKGLFRYISKTWDEELFRAKNNFRVPILVILQVLGCSNSIAVVGHWKEQKRKKMEILYLLAFHICNNNKVTKCSYKLYVVLKFFFLLEVSWDFILYIIYHNDMLISVSNKLLFFYKSKNSKSETWPHSWQSRNTIFFSFLQYVLKTLTSSLAIVEEGPRETKHYILLVFDLDSKANFVSKQD